MKTFNTKYTTYYRYPRDDYPVSYSFKIFHNVKNMFSLKQDHTIKKKMETIQISFDLYNNQ